VKITVKGILHWQQWTYEKEGRYVIHTDDMSAYSSDHCHYAPIKPVEIELEIDDDFDPRPGIIEGLRKQKAQVVAEAQLKATQIEERIQTLLCLENKVPQ
jgi:hypothetical protein